MGVVLVDQTANSESGTEKRPLHLLTTATVLAELVSGRDLITVEGHSFSRPDDVCRSILNWYRENPSAWTGNLKAADCATIVERVDQKPPTIDCPDMAASSMPKTLKLKRMVAHRFGGLHAYGKVGAAPEVFTFEPTKDVVLFEGWNGSGKTSIMNAIVWCLTGELLRAQRPPDNGSLEFLCTVDRDGEENSEHSISSVTPLPDRGLWAPQSSEPMPADTWVELTFVDERGEELPKLRRQQSRNARGKLLEQTTGHDLLPIDPVALRLGSTMPGMLPFLQVGSASELGTSVARLTGLAEFVDLAKHAEKAAARLAGQETKSINEKIADIEARFLQARGDIEARCVEFPAMRPEAGFPYIADEEVADRLEWLIEHFTNLKSESFAAAKEYLGDSFDPTNSESRADLEKRVGPAIDRILNLRELSNIKRMVSAWARAEVSYL